MRELNQQVNVYNVDLELFIGIQQEASEEICNGVVEKKPNSIKLFKIVPIQEGE